MIEQSVIPYQTLYLTQIVQHWHTRRLELGSCPDIRPQLPIIIFVVFFFERGGGVVCSPVLNHICFFFLLPELSNLAHMFFYQRNPATRLIINRTYVWTQTVQHWNTRWLELGPRLNIRPQLPIIIIVVFVLTGEVESYVAQNWSTYALFSCC